MVTNLGLEFRRAQQCAEKYLKSYLTSKDVTVEKIHDLTRINNICIEIE